MDPCSRHIVWNLLKYRKANRVTVLSTHFMDEADILAGEIFALFSKIFVMSQNSNGHKNAASWGIKNTHLISSAASCGLPLKRVRGPVLLLDAGYIGTFCHAHVHHPDSCKKKPMVSIKHWFVVLYRHYEPLLPFLKILGIFPKCQNGPKLAIKSFSE